MQPFETTEIFGGLYMPIAPQVGENIENNLWVCIFMEFKLEFKSVFNNNCYFQLSFSNINVVVRRIGGVFDINS